MRVLRVSAAAGLATLGLLVAGCGGGDGDGDGAGVPKSEWLEGANALCKEYVDKWADVDEPADLAAATRLIEDIAADAREFARRYEELGTPEGAEERHRESLEQNRRAVTLSEELLEATRAIDGPRLQELVEEMDVLGSESSALARELGADECARSAFTEGLR